MLFFGHVGITTGVFRVCDALLTRAELRAVQRRDSAAEFEVSAAKWSSGLTRAFLSIKNRIGNIDYRLVAIGSLLPDIFDKPVFLLLGNFIPLSGRGYTHTLLFNLILLLGGLVFIKYRKPWLLVISLASLLHLVFDRIWDRPVVLLYPVLGSIPSAETTGWFGRLISSFFNRPDEWVWEIFGLAIILFLGYRLFKKKAVISFIKSGTLI